MAIESTPTSFSHYNTFQAAVKIAQLKKWSNCGSYTPHKIAPQKQCCGIGTVGTVTF
jgi:hypothetical protein